MISITQAAYSAFALGLVGAAAQGCAATQPSLDLNAANVSGAATAR